MTIQWCAWRSGRSTRAGSTPDSATLTGPGPYISALDQDSVYSYASSGNDTAHFDSEGQSYTSSVDWGTWSVTGTGFYHYGTGYDSFSES